MIRSMSYCPETIISSIARASWREVTKSIVITFSGLDLILNAISKEILEKQPPEAELKKTIALYLKRELKMRETNGFSALDVPAEKSDSWSGIEVEVQEMAH